MLAGVFGSMEVDRVHCVEDEPNNVTVSQPPGRGINYTGPREVLLEFVILVF